MSVEVFIHVHVGSNPGALFFVDKGFNVGILAVSHDSHKKIRRNEFTSIRIDDLRGITCPVHFDLFPGLSVEVHRGATLLLILLDVVAKLGIHKRFVA